MSVKPQKAVLLNTLFVNGHRIQMGSAVDIMEISDISVLIRICGYAMAVPRHLITIVPPDSPRVHEHKKKSNKRKK